MHAVTMSLTVSGCIVLRRTWNLLAKDAECIFYDPPGSGKPVVQYALWPRHTPEAVGARPTASSCRTSGRWHRK